MEFIVTMKIVTLASIISIYVFPSSCVDNCGKRLLLNDPSHWQQEIQALQAQVQALRNDHQALKNNNSALQNRVRQLESHKDVLRK